LGDFNANVEREDIFKLVIWNNRLYKTSSDRGDRVVMSATSKILVAERTMIPQRKINKYTWTAPDGKPCVSTDHVKKDRRRQSGILGIR
jgi:hypothetical protein